MNKDQAFEKWYEKHGTGWEIRYQLSAFRAAWDIQQRKINKLVEAASNVTVLTNTDFNKLWAKKLEEALSSVEE